MSQQNGTDKVLPYYREFDGYRLCGAFDLDNFRSARDYKAQPGERYLVTYPKCGTTWCQMIIHLIINDGVPPKTFIDLSIRQPFIEAFGVDFQHNPDPNMKPYVLKTHLPFELTPYHPEAHYLYIVRNPKDACVSFFHHTKMIDGYKFAAGKFDDYFDLWIEGKVDYMDYFENVVSWWKHRDDQNIHIMTYEFMKANPREAILKIAKFLGEEHHQKLVSNSKLLDDVAYYSSIEYMKSMNNTMTDFWDEDTEKIANNPHIPPGFKRVMLNMSECAKEMKPIRAKLNPEENTGTFVRKGQVNDWKNYFTPEQNERMKAKFMKYAQEYGIDKIWDDLSWL